jgi:hypothetical protein
MDATERTKRHYEATKRFYKERLKLRLRKKWLRQVLADLKNPKPSHPLTRPSTPSDEEIPTGHHNG